MWRKVNFLIVLGFTLAACSAPSAELLEPVEVQQNNALAIPLPEPTAEPESYAIVTVPTAVPNPISYPEDHSAVQEAAVEPSGVVNLEELEADGTGGLSPTVPEEYQDQAIEAPRPISPNQQVVLESLVTQDLAKKLGIDVSEITVVESLKVSWNDSSLGCPQPDMMYAQMITDGFWFDLSANGASYRYHTDSGMTFILCEDSQRPA